MKRLGLTALAVLALAGPARAAKIGEIVDTSWIDQAARFMTLSDPSVRYGLGGALLLGLTCGLLGGFLVLRRLSLMGDTLGHAVLPGVMAAYMVTGVKAVGPLLLGAAITGFLGAASVWVLTRYSRLKEDTAMGLVLSSFFGAGIVLLTMIQKQGSGNQSGLDKFLFGQAAALGPGDLQVMAVSAVLTLLLVGLLFKELVVTAFDPGFATSIGVRADGMHILLMGLVTFAIVSSIHAVGVVLVAAMLILPAATAHLLTDRMVPYLVLSAGIGMISGAAGAFFSFLGASLPTGPCMVLTGGILFGLAWAFGPSHGRLSQILRHMQRAARVQRENTLKSIYLVMETRGLEPLVSLGEVAARRGETVAELRRRLGALARRRLALVEGQTVRLTPEGLETARKVVRNHRLWELYLTHEADIAADHVHRDAEEIEHVLGPDLVAELESRLGPAEVDPHGRPIPRRAS